MSEINKNLLLVTDKYKLIGGYVKIVAEDRNTSTLYNTYIKEAAFEFALKIEDGDLVNYCDKEEDFGVDAICTAAQDIYDRFLTGETTYDVFAERQKLMGYKFITKEGKDYNVIIPWVKTEQEAELWRKKHDHKKYIAVLA